MIVADWAFEISFDPRKDLQRSPNFRFQHVCLLRSAADFFASRIVAILNEYFIFQKKNKNLFRIFIIKIESQKSR